jgi:hypothetical protein
MASAEKWVLETAELRSENEPFQANNYLLSKFDRHVCTGEDPPPKTRIEKLGGSKFETELMQEAAERHYTRDSSWQHWPGSCSGQKL